MLKRISVDRRVCGFQFRPQFIPGGPHLPDDIWGALGATEGRARWRTRAFFHHQKFSVGSKPLYSNSSVSSQVDSPFESVVNYPPPHYCQIFPEIKNCVYGNLPLLPHYGLIYQHRQWQGRQVAFTQPYSTVRQTQKHRESPFSIHLL